MIVENDNQNIRALILKTFVVSTQSILDANLNVIVLAESSIRSFHSIVVVIFGGILFDEFTLFN